MNKQHTPLAHTKQLTLTALMTAALCLIAPFSIPLPLSPVPISLATFVLYLDIFILGPKLGILSCILYLLLGFVGLPVFSGFSGGIGRLFGPTGGYMIGYLFLILIGGNIVERSHGKKSLSAFGLALGTICTYIFGTTWLSRQMNLTFLQGLAAGVIPYLPGDILKIIAALIIGPILKNRIKQL